MSSASITRQTASGHVGFAVEITPKKPSTRSRKPEYISPSTQSLAIYTDNELHPVVVNLTPSSPDCSADPKHPGSYVCTASLNVPSGNHVFTILAYDQTGGTGYVLSTNTTGTVYVKPTGTTTVSVVLEGIVYSVSLAFADSSPPAGTPAVIPLTVVLEDADDNVIIGPAPFDNPVTLTTSDATNGPLSKTILNSPADAAGITVKYSGAELSAITYGAAAAPGPNAPESITVLNAVLRPSESWKVPTDWNDNNNTIELIGGGGAGQLDGGGGGGGAYTKVTNVRLAAGPCCRSASAAAEPSAEASFLHRRAATRTSAPMRIRAPAPGRSLSPRAAARVAVEGMALIARVAAAERPVPVRTPPRSRAATAATALSTASPPAAEAVRQVRSGPARGAAAAMASRMGAEAETAAVRPAPAGVAMPIPPLGRTLGETARITTREPEARSAARVMAPMVPWVAVVPGAPPSS